MHFYSELMRIVRVQDAKIRNDVFEMPAAPGQVPAMFAVAPADEGDTSDCECVGEIGRPERAGRTIELG